MAATRPSTTSAACACGRLRRATRALTQLYDDAMAPSGLRVTQFSLLRTLEREGSKPVTALATALLLDRTALSRTLEPLVARGLVIVAAGPDARTRAVSLTGAGRRAVRGASPHWRKAQRVVAERIGPEKLDALIATLRELESLHPATRSRGLHIP